MTKLQYEFLCRYRDWDYPDPQWLMPEDFSIFQSCKAAKYIKSVGLPDGNWGFCISDLGKADMLELEQNLKDAREDDAREEARQRAKEEADRAQALVDQKQQQRHDFKVAAFSGLVTLFVEHIFDLVDFIKSALEIAGHFLFH